MILRLLKRLFTAEALGLILVFTALWALSYGVAASLRAMDTSYLFKVCLVAALIGVVLGRGRAHGALVALGITVIGMLGVWIVGARLAYPLIQLFRSLDSIVPQVVPSIRHDLPIDMGVVKDAWLTVARASSALLSRWQAWLLGFQKELTVNDALIRNMIWTLLMWLIAAWTGWFAAKRNAILSMLPGIGLLALIISYSEYRSLTLWLMVFILLLLMGLWNYKNHTTLWEHRRVDYSDSILYDSTQAVLLLAFSIGILAFVTPSISWRQMRDFLRQRNQTNQAAEMLGIQQQTVPSKNTPGIKPSLPREHLLTEGFAQSREIVMTIRTGELPPIPDRALAGPVPRYYWRSSIYDQYRGTGWVTGVVLPQNYRANSPLIPGLLSGYRPLHMDVHLQQPEGRLFWSGILYSADHPFRVDWRVRPPANLFARQGDLLQADLFIAVSGTTAYSADSYISTATIADLRAASTAYPEDISTRYLDLPQELPARVRDLAKQIVSGNQTPYDKAKAIESYLRTNYPYDLNIPAPPQDRDVSDYFLFELKRGYCDYYATAMVVLARAAGLPARFVSGYASGSYDAPNAQYVVRELDAHSWPEIYFPEIGWIEFEPTGSQPEILRVETQTEASASKPITPASRILFQFTHGRLLYWLSTVATVIVLAVLYFAFFEKILFMNLAPAIAIERLYRRYYRLGRSLAGAYTRAETAHEFTNKLIGNVYELQSHFKNAQAANVQVHSRLLTDLYASSLFSNRPMQKKDAGLAFHIWKNLRRSLVKARIYKMIQKATKRNTVRMNQ